MMERLCRGYNWEVVCDTVKTVKHALKKYKMQHAPLELLISPPVSHFKAVLPS
jgi:hypothetical protein